MITNMRSSMRSIMSQSIGFFFIGKQELGKLSDRGLVLNDSRLLEAGRVADIVFSSGVRVRGKIDKPWRRNSSEGGHLLGIELLDYEMSLPDTLVQKLNPTPSPRYHGRSMILGLEVK